MLFLEKIGFEIEKRVEEVYEMHIRLRERRNAWEIEK